MTTKEFWERRKRAMALEARALTIINELRDSGDPLRIEAADVIEYLRNSRDQFRKDLNEEVREGQRAVRDAYAEGRAKRGEDF